MRVYSLYKHIYGYIMSVAIFWLKAQSMFAWHPDAASASCRGSGRPDRRG